MGTPKGAPVSPPSTISSTALMYDSEARKSTALAKSSERLLLWSPIILLENRVVARVPPSNDHLHYEKPTTLSEGPARQYWESFGPSRTCWQVWTAVTKHLNSGKSQMGHKRKRPPAISMSGTRDRSLRSNVARRLAHAFSRKFRCRDHRGAARSITGTRQRGKLGPIST